MKRYWQFLIVGVICLVAALLWAEPAHKYAPQPVTPVSAQSTSEPSAQSSAKLTADNAADKNSKEKVDADDPLPGSSSSLPLLAVIGFGVLAGGITSAMRTRE